MNDDVFDTDCHRFDRSDDPPTLRDAEPSDRRATDSSGRRPVEPEVHAAPKGADPGSCDFCHRVLASGDGYHQLEVGMTDAPLFVGGPVSYVENASVIVMCAACEPSVTEHVDGLLMALWALRHPEETVSSSSGEGVNPEEGREARP